MDMLGKGRPVTDPMVRFEKLMRRDVSVVRVDVRCSRCRRVLLRLYGPARRDFKFHGPWAQERPIVSVQSMQPSDPGGAGDPAVEAGRFWGPGDRAPDSPYRFRCRCRADVPVRGDTLTAAFDRVSSQPAARDRVIHVPGDLRTVG